MSELTNEFKKELLSDKEARHAYFNQLLNIFVATQLKVLREQRELTQEELAEESKGFTLFDNEGKPLKQERISAMENVDYASWSMSSLRKLAWALDLRLKVSFEEFGTGLREFQRFSREFLQRRSVNDDTYFKLESVPGTDGNRARMRMDVTEDSGSPVSLTIPSTAEDMSLSIPLSAANQ